MLPSTERPVIERDLSWLHFNGRVLQEARDWRVPLYARIKFLAIYSSNLDEFYRVRVASLRSFKKLRKKTRKELLSVKPKKILREIRQLVEQQQNLFGQTFRQEILPELARAGIHLIDETALKPAHQAFVEQYFFEKTRVHLEPTLLNPTDPPPFLQNKGLYLAVEFEGESECFGLLQIPTDELPRFLKLPEVEGQHYILFLDDLIRYGLPSLFPGYTVRAAYSLKLSRDAEMYIDDEYSGNLVEKIREALEERSAGLPTRFLYDAATPLPLLVRFKTMWNLKKDDLIPGARYHNFSDFFQFPNPADDPALEEPPQPPLPHPVLESSPSLLATIEARDQSLHFPYQRFDYIPRLIREAADHPEVTRILITLYRVASDSAVSQALLHACKQGKEVVVFVEAKARFDEATNLYWGKQLADRGAQVIYSYPGIKVHTKLLLIQTSGQGISPFFSYIGTGNFNEKTAGIYADHALLTAHPEIGQDVVQVFQLLQGNLLLPRPRHLLLSPYTLRNRFMEMIDQEIQNAQAGKEAYMVLKMNSLEDELMIDKLYEASQAGVRIDLIVRGICRLTPEASGWSENIRVRSIIDRYLEHARLYLFANGGQEVLFLASADWMTRNLDQRIEVGAPIYDPEIFQELKYFLNLQMRDNTKARRITADHDNPYWVDPGQPPVRAQQDAYAYFLQKNAAAAF